MKSFKRPTLVVLLLILVLFGRGRGQASTTGEACGFALKPNYCSVCFFLNSRLSGESVFRTTRSSSEWNKSWLTRQPANSESERSCLHSTPLSFEQNHLGGIPSAFEIPKLKASLETSADNQAQTPPSGDVQELAKKLSNPVASLISLPFQSNFDFGMGDGSGWRYTLNIQPVIPIALSPKWNMISRTILPIIHQHNVVGTSSQSGLGDLSQSLFFSPTDSKRFIWGVGPQLLIPTATNDLLGTRKLAIGPTFLILKQKEAWTSGALTNHVWSVAGSDSRASVNSTFIQPFLSYNTKEAWTYGLNAEMSYDWTGNHWSIPIHFTISKLVRFGKHPVSFGGALRCWATSPEGGPENCGFRIIITPLFPK